VAEDHGLVGGFEAVSDTNMPLNVNDNDLSPQMQIPPFPKEKWTEMTMFLITVETNKIFARIHRRFAQSQHGKDHDMHDQFWRLVAEFDTFVNKRYLIHCDQNIPIQKATIIVRPYTS
jgi:hypothetical protein